MDTPHQEHDILLINDYVARVMQVRARTTASDMLLIEDRALLQRHESTHLMTFMGTLKQGDSAQHYRTLDDTLMPLDAYALFREGDATAPHVIHVLKHRPAPAGKPNVWLPLVLFVATVLSVMFTGMTIAVGEIALTDLPQALALAQEPLANLWRGLPYALSIMLILGAHELGHYVMMRRYGVASSLPYFIPAFAVSPFGTFGATIALKETLGSRKMLFDVGVSGPLAGLVFAVAILLYGLATSQVIPMSDGGWVEGNSALYALAKLLVFGQFLPNGEVDVLVNQYAWAGWTGLFVTALNLIPLGQLDGGHVLYAFMGSWARKLYTPFLLMMAFFVLFVSTAWLILVLLLALLGRFYALPLDDITPLDPFRQRVAFAVFVLFGLIFVPSPLSQTGVMGGLLGLLLSAA